MTNVVPNRSFRIFLCHASGDKPAVRELYHRLCADGFTPWLDEEKLLGGHDWDLEIRKAVRAADVVIVCLSRGALTKAGYVQKEIRFALDVADEQPEGTIFLIPLRLEQCDVPQRLSRLQWVNFYDADGYERLLKALQLRAIDLPSTGVYVNTDSGEVRVDGKLVSMLTDQEYRLLLLFYDRLGKLCDKAWICQAMWGTEYIAEMDDARIEKSISRLRTKIEPDPANPKYLQTARGRGYKLMSP